MKRLSYVLTIFAVFLFGGGYVLADVCDKDAIDKYQAEAENVNVSFEPVETEVIGEGYDGEETRHIEYSVNINIYNLTENLYVRVENENDGSIENYYYSDSKDDLITINVTDIDVIQDFNLEFYSVDCDEEVYDTDIEIPMYNIHSSLVVCDETPDFYLCQTLTFDDVDSKEFDSKRDAYLEDPDNNGNTVDDSDNDDNKESNNIIYIIAGVLGVGVVGIVIFVIYKKRKMVI